MVRWSDTFFVNIATVFLWNLELLLDLNPFSQSIVIRGKLRERSFPRVPGNSFLEQKCMDKKLTFNAQKCGTTNYNPLGNHHF